jgi:hypothetical protein
MLKVHDLSNEHIAASFRRQNSTTQKILTAMANNLGSYLQLSSRFPAYQLHDSFGAPMFLEINPSSKKRAKGLLVRVEGRTILDDRFFLNPDVERWILAGRLN